MVNTDKIRASGLTPGVEEANKALKEMDTPLLLEPERPLNLTRAFQRMRTDWNSKDREIIESVKVTVDQQIFEKFSDAYSLMYEIYDTVRFHVVDEEGDFKFDHTGLAIWETNRDGSYHEDWSRIGKKERERFLHIIITRMFEWEQTSADIWGEAMFAKAQLDEAFSTAFDSITDTKATVDARTARANRLAADQRYLAVYKSMYSRKADGLVRALLGISQRLKDLHLS